MLPYWVAQIIGGFIGAAIVYALYVPVIDHFNAVHHFARDLDAGAAGYMTKNASPDELLLAVRRVTAGGRYVEAEVAQALAAPGAGACTRSVAAARATPAMPVMVPPPGAVPMTEASVEPGPLA